MIVHWMVRVLITTAFLSLAALLAEMIALTSISAVAHAQQMQIQVGPDGRINMSGGQISDAIQQQLTVGISQMLDMASQVIKVGPAFTAIDPTTRTATIEFSNPGPDTLDASVVVTNRDPGPMTC